MNSIIKATAVLLSVGTLAGHASTTKTDLYSESLYLTRSSAEVPGAIPREGDQTLADEQSRSPSMTMETAAEALQESKPLKKTAKKQD